MNCKIAKIYFDDYLNDNISPSDKIELEQHLTKCPTCREELASEKHWIEILRLDKVKDPGDNYWQNLENRIFEKTIEAEYTSTEKYHDNDTKTKITIFKYLIPLAASFLLFAASISNNFFANKKQPDLIADSESINNNITNNNLIIKEKPEILGTILMSAPGSAGRHLTIGRLRQI